MDKIIDKYFKLYFGEEPESLEERKRWYDDWATFKFGWMCHAGWEEEQAMMDKDYLEDMSQEEALRKGLA